MQFICVHCGKGKTKYKHNRGLCWKCYYAPGIRERYPNPPKIKTRPDLTEPKVPEQERRLPPRTMTLPNTEARIEVMAWRVANGYHPTNPNDRTLDDVTATPELLIYKPPRQKDSCKKEDDSISLLA